MKKWAYYNDVDPYVCRWVENLIAAGHVAPGVIDCRPIQEVKADDLREFVQVHMFCGIAGWSVALRLADWPDDRPVWTGSCPCQPFSAAGAGKAADDERHLWPAWFSLIAECKPAIVFGEQVEAAIGWGWLDAIFADLEGEGYACGATVLPACGVGAPHIRQRLWFVADADGGDASTEGLQRSGEQRFIAQDGSLHNWLGDPDCERWAVGIWLAGDDGTASGPVGRQAAIKASYWSDCDWLPCADGRSRPVEPGSFPLAHGVQRRPSKLRAYGNAINPQVAAEFIIAASEAIIEISGGTMTAPKENTRDPLS